MQKSIQPNFDLAALKRELAQLEIEADDCSRNYSNEERVAMRDGKARRGAAPNERMAREKFARINEITLILKTLTWLACHRR
ncbi:MAG: hypothetical protein Q7R54_01395 [bacterium]|nr:hypothetical protein [bacterium]